MLKALINLVEYKKTHVDEHIKSLTLANALGDALEGFISDAFAGTFNVDSEERLEIHNKCFSWKGNQNNSPDLIIREGDAIEVKKTQSVSSLPLNSSFPKATIAYNSFGVSHECSICEGENKKWKKDIIYACGVVTSNKILKNLFFVYGDIFAANEVVYSRIKSKMQQGVESIPGVVFSRTKELGRINRVDPLGITYLRIRGMWGIEHPLKAFSYLNDVKTENDKNVVIYCLMSKEKHTKFESNEVKILNSYSEVKQKNVRIKNPNNPANLIDTVLYKIAYK